MIHEVVGRVIRHRSPQEHSGFIAYSTLDEASANAEIDAQVAFFSALGLPFEWKVYDHDRPADLRQRLAARGFVIEDPEALLVLDMDNAPDFYESMVVPDAVERVTTSAGIEGLFVWKRRSGRPHTSGWASGWRAILKTSLIW